MEMLFAIIVLLVLIWYSFLKPLTYWKDQGVKQTNPWPIFGDLWSNIFKRTAYSDLIAILYNMYPNRRYTGIYQFSSPTLLLRDPDLIKDITVKYFDHFTDHRPLIDPEIDPLSGGVLFLLKGQKWREMRTTLSGAFTSSKMKSIFYLMEEAAEKFVKFFLDKNTDMIEVEMRDIYTRVVESAIRRTIHSADHDYASTGYKCFRYTNDLIATAAFGIQCDSFAKPNNEFYLMGKKIADFNNVRSIITFFGYLFVPRLFSLMKIPFFGEAENSFFSSMIKEIIQVREEKGIVRPDMINLLLEARRGVKKEVKDKEPEAIETGLATAPESTHTGNFKQIKNFTDELITSQALNFFLAGLDPISIAMCFGSYELAVNQEIQDKLRNEIKETYKYYNGKIFHNDLLNMKYLDMVVLEILRIWPPVPEIDRICTKAFTIKAVNSDEVPVQLKPGDLIMLPIHGLHRDPAYFPNPDKFDPERFSEENKHSIKPYSYIPFGSGPRNCIGSRFAQLEIKSLLFKLLLNFKIIPSKKTQIPLKLQKHGESPAAEGGFWFALKRIKK